jgi:asparagine synthase (glutamine-hydrolysing)
VSGFVGILHIDGSPVDRGLLQRLTNFQAFRGLDAKRVWRDGRVGFGHTLLRTTDESLHERQPFSLDGKIWIVADARVDARSDLIALLRLRGHEHLALDAPDVELILRSYHVWGEDCVLHLLGDFAFAIWDGPRQSLFCARDHMGVKPFFYANLGSTVVFSNTLDCVRLHPAISDKLNDLAIADYLLFEFNEDQGTTSFADVQRLRPAHRAVWSRGGLSTSRYWTMPVDDPIFYKRPEEYVERFRELSREAVADRLRTNRVGIFMSGGLDSTTLAATASEVLRERHGSSEVLAITQTDTDLPEERECAELVARQLGIPIRFFDWGSISVDQTWEQHPQPTSEPGTDPWTMRAHKNFWREVESAGRVFLFGEGPDNALQFDWWPYVSLLIRERRFGRLVRDLSSTLASDWRPPFWTRARRGVETWLAGEKERPPTFPEWIEPTLATRLQLRARWAELPSPTTVPHPLRPEGYASFQYANWQELFEWHDAGRTRSCFEVRHPFMDLRVLRYLLSIPALPWCRAKHLVRRSMQGVLPKPVLRRRKSGLRCSALMEKVRRAGLAPFVPTVGISAYVVPDQIPAKASRNMSEFGAELRARALNLWLRNQLPMGQNCAVEDYPSNEAVFESTTKTTGKEAI